MVPRTTRTTRVASLVAVGALLSACGGASDEVKQSVVMRQAAAGSVGLAAAGPVAPLTSSGASSAQQGAPVPAGLGQAAPDSARAADPAKVGAQAQPGSPKSGGPKKGGAQERSTPKDGAPQKKGSALTAPGPAAAGCAAAAPAGGNGGATDTGVTASTIKIGGTFFNGGFLDKYGQVTENAPRAYFNYINDSGGICGRKIDYVTCDTAGTADGTTGCLTRLADQEKVFTLGPSLDFNLDIVQPALARRKLPWVGSSGLYDAEFTSPWMFPTQPPGANVGALMAQFAATKLGVKKIGISFLNDAAGPTCTERAKEVAAARGVQAVATASNTAVETSLDSAVAKLRNAGADSVLFCNDPVNTVKFIQAAQRVGWKPVFLGGFVAADDVPQAAGTNGKGMYGLTFYDFYKSDSPGVRQYRQITEYYYPQTFHHFYEQAAYTGAVAIVEALRAAGPKLTRDGFLKAVRSMRSFDAGLGLQLDFGNLAGGTPNGIILKAGDELAWQVFAPRFAVKAARTAGAPAQSDEPATQVPAARRATRAGRRS